MCETFAKANQPAEIEVLSKAKKTDKSKLPSRHVSVGPASAPHRAFYYAMGMTEAEIAQPFIGVATTWNEAAPCNIALARQAHAALVYTSGIWVLGETDGPADERTMAFCDDPSHHWIRTAWEQQEQDSRCPMTSAR